MLSELEGAVMTEIGHRSNTTRFQVRRAFQQSPSSSWSGSAGAVYPAIDRLARAGLVHMGDPVAGRGTRPLSLTKAGESALEGWFTNAAAACTIGADPFRLRAGLWITLPADRRRQVLTAMAETVAEEMAKLDGRDDLDPVEQVGNELARRQQQMRLNWLHKAMRLG